MAQPETNSRLRQSQSDEIEQPQGSHNIIETNGKRLMETSKRHDPNKAFSNAPRVSRRGSKKDNEHAPNQSASVPADSNLDYIKSTKFCEVNQSDVLSPPRLDATPSEAISTTGNFK